MPPSGLCLRVAARAAFGGLLFSWSFASSAFAGCLLCSGHGCCCVVTGGRVMGVSGVPR